VLECLKPNTPSGSGAGIRNAAPASEPSPKGVANEENPTGERMKEGFSDCGARESRNGGDGGVKGGSERTGERADNRLVMHTCWVKSGHEVVHEREPFLRALLHKVRKSSCSMSAKPPE